MGKKLSDYPWFGLHWAGVFADTIGMSDAEFRAYFVDAYKAWRACDIDALPPAIKASALDIVKVAEARKPKDCISEHKQSNDSKSLQKTMSSPVLSCNMSSVVKNDDTTDTQHTTDIVSSKQVVCTDTAMPLFREFISCYPTWEQYEVNALNAWKFEIENNPGFDPQAAVDSARQYRVECAMKNTPPRYVKTPHRFLSDGMWANSLRKPVEEVDLFVTGDGGGW